MAFSATDAALEGFRITRARPVAVLAWSALQLVFGVAGQVIAVTLVGPAFFELQKLETQIFTPASTAASERLIQLAPSFLPAAGLTLLLAILLSGILSAAVNRAIRRPDEGRFGWLGLGRAELVQIGAIGAVLGLLLVAHVGFTCAATVVAGVISLVAGAAVLAPLVALIVIADIGLLVWLAVRLSLVAPMSFEAGRITLQPAWRMTAGRFQPLFLTYLLAAVLAVLISILVGTIGSAVVASIPGQAIPALHGAGVQARLDYVQTHPPSLTDFAKPVTWITLVFSALAAGLTTAVVQAPAIQAYRQLKAAPTA